jgi:hypothetical protein
MLFLLSRAEGRALLPGTIHDKKASRYDMPDRGRKPGRLPGAAPLAPCRMPGGGEGGLVTPSRSGSALENLDRTSEDYTANAFALSLQRF